MNKVYVIIKTIALVIFTTLSIASVPLSFMFDVHVVTKVMFIVCAALAIISMSIVVFKVFDMIDK